MRRFHLLAVALLWGCPAAKDRGPAPYPTPSVEATGDVVATVGPVNITTDELQKRIRAQSPFQRVTLKDPKKLAKFVDDEIRMEVLAQEAWRRGSFDDPRVQKKLRRAMVEVMMKDHLASVEKQLDVSQTDLMTEYKRRFDEFNKPERIRLSQIVKFAKTDAEVAAAKKLLEKLRREIEDAQKKNEHNRFVVLAAKHSDDKATNRGGGDLQFLSRGELTERYGLEVAQHMFDQVKIGDTTVAVAKDAVVLFKKTGRRRAVVRTVEQVKPQLRGQLMGRKKTAAFNTFVEGLKKQHGVFFDESLLTKLDVEIGKERSAPPTAAKGKKAPPKPAPSPATKSAP